MKHLKLKPRWKLFFGILGSISALGIIGLFVPYGIWGLIFGNEYAEGAKYGIFIIIEVFCINTLIIALVNIRTLKKLYAELNAFRDKLDENAYFVAGYCQMVESHDKDTVDAMVARLGETAASVLFGNAIYGVFTNKKGRMFIICDNGMYVIRVKSGFKLSFVKVIFTKGKFKDATVTDGGKDLIKLTCPNENIIFTFSTKKADVTKEELTQDLQNLYINA